MTTSALPTDKTLRDAGVTISMDEMFELAKLREASPATAVWKLPI